MDREWTSDAIEGSTIITYEKGCREIDNERLARADIAG